MVYEPPLFTVEERGKLSPANQSRKRARMRIDLWRELEGDALAEEVAKLRIQLMYQHRAQKYAEKNDLPLKEFNPDPSMLLIELSSLDDEAARRWIVGRLQGTP